MCLIVFLIKQQLVCIYFNSPEQLEEFTDCKTDVFVLFDPPQRLSLNNISPLWIWLMYPLKEEGRHMAARSTKHVISTSSDGPWGCLLLCCDLTSAFNGSLCDRCASGKGHWRATKRHCCGFWEADGAVYQMGVWGSNKPDYLGGSTRTVNTASSRIWSTQMLARIYFRPVTLTYLHNCAHLSYCSTFR